MLVEVVELVEELRLLDLELETDRLRLLDKLLIFDLLRDFEDRLDSDEEDRHIIVLRSLDRERLYLNIKLKITSKFTNVNRTK